MFIPDLRSVIFKFLNDYNEKVQVKEAEKSYMIGSVFSEMDTQYKLRKQGKRWTNQICPNCKISFSEGCGFNTKYFYCGHFFHQDCEKGFCTACKKEG